MIKGELELTPTVDLMDALLNRIYIVLTLG
jgi:hypothetical protein